MGSFPFKLAAVDLDDTLLGPDKKVGQANRDALERLRSLGCDVILASGRRHDNMLPFYRDLGLGGYAVSCQGASAKHVRTGQFVHHAPLDPASAAEVTDLGTRRNLTVMYWSNWGICASERSPWVQRYEADCGDPVPVVEDMGSVTHKPAEKIIWAAEPQVIRALAPEMQRRYQGRLNVITTDDWFLEFSSLNATKAAGLAAVAETYGVRREEVLAFGDGNNDVPMLEWAGMSVAMSHGRPSAKAAARVVAPDGDPESSFARAVEGVIRAASGSTRAARSSGHSAGRDAALVPSLENVERDLWKSRALYWRMP
jgi:Cof subfamily protein (haloacid dehalogenase superfamily)